MGQKAGILFCSVIHTYIHIRVYVYILLECYKMLITEPIRQNYLYGSIKVRPEDVFVPTL